jgi:hypothetical protein
LLGIDRCNKCNYNIHQRQKDLPEKIKEERKMDVSGVGSSQSTYAAYSSSAKKTTDTAAAETATEKTSAASETGVVYESSSSSTTQSTKATTSEQRAAIVAKMKADLEERTTQMQQLVQQMLTKQGNTYNNANDIWSTLASGNFTVDAQTKAQAQADIAEDGYWGVTQTSDRIFDFAQALAGDDTEKMKQMQEAFEKGYKQAEKTWGGSLPQISQDTYAAVSKKFEEYFSAQESES